MSSSALLTSTGLHIPLPSPPLPSPFPPSLFPGIPAAHATSHSSSPPLPLQQALGCPCRSCNSLVEVRATESELSRAVKAEIGCVALVRVVQGGKPGSVEMLRLLHQHGALINGQVRAGGRLGRPIFWRTQI